MAARNSSRLVLASVRVAGEPSRLMLSRQVTIVRAKSTLTADVSPVSVVAGRFKSMTEIAVSKIFPAGAGWQAAAVAATAADIATNSPLFFLATGVGDAVGVGIGHSAYMYGKGLVTGNVNMKAEAQTALLLSSAAFCSGFLWQASVNALAPLGFTAAATGTGVVCGLAFFTGLRISRSLYSSLGMQHIAAPDYRNLRDDAALSASIGGASAGFVGTDVTIADNFLRPIVGVEATASAVEGITTAGASTALGFTAVQTAQNVALPVGRNWLDGEARE